MSERTLLCDDMLVFDLVYAVREHNTELGVYFWYEKFPDYMIEVSPNTYVMVGDTVADLCEQMLDIFPDDFPDEKQLMNEIRAVHQLNRIQNKNNVGIVYPIYTDRDLNSLIMIEDS